MRKERVLSANLPAGKEPPTPQPRKPSVIEQLKSISKTLEGLIYYEFDVGIDMSDAIDYLEIKRVIDAKLYDIVNRSKK